MDVGIGYEGLKRLGRRAECPYYESVHEAALSGAFREAQLAHHV